MSAKTGRAPVDMMASAVKAADSGDVMTSSPAPMPSARRMSASASVPLPTPTACRAPCAAANSASKASTSGPARPAAGDDAIDGRGYHRRVLARREGRERNAGVAGRRSAHARAPDALSRSAGSTYRSKCWR